MSREFSPAMKARNFIQQLHNLGPGGTREYVSPRTGVRPLLDKSFVLAGTATPTLATRLLQMLGIPLVPHHKAMRAERSYTLGIFNHAVEALQKRSPDKTTLLHWIGSDVGDGQGGRSSVPAIVEADYGHWEHLCWTPAAQQELLSSGLRARVLPCVMAEDWDVQEEYPERPTALVYWPDRRPDLYGMDRTAEVAGRLPDWRFVFLGSDELPQAARALKNCEAVGFLKGAARRRAFEDATCGLRLTRHDGFPRMIVEMALLGKQTVCTHRFPLLPPVADVDGAVVRLEEIAGGSPSPALAAYYKRVYSKTQLKRRFLEPFPMHGDRVEAIRTGISGSVFDIVAGCLDIIEAEKARGNEVFVSADVPDVLGVVRADLNDIVLDRIYVPAREGKQGDSESRVETLYYALYEGEVRKDLDPLPVFETTRKLRDRILCLLPDSPEKDRAARASLASNLVMYL